MLKIIRLLVLVGFMVGLARPTYAQSQGRLPPEYLAKLTGRLPLPVAAATGHVAYCDSVRVSEAADGKLVRQLMSGFARQFLPPDYPLNPADTLNLPKPRRPAAPGEYVLVGSVQVIDFENPPPVYVAGITPPLDPRATYPSYPHVSFTLRSRVRGGYATLTLTDLRVRLLPFDYPLNRLMAGYQNQRGGGAAARPPRPVGQPIEVRYAPWLAGAKRSPSTEKQASPLATEAEARRLDFTMRQIRSYLRKQLAGPTLSSAPVPEPAPPPAPR